MFIAYNLLILLLSPVWVPWMLWRSSRRKEGPNWAERTGDYKHIQIPKGQPAIWIHAVSVGEVVACLPILRHLKALAPNHIVVLSVTTSSGHRTAVEHAVGLYDKLVYFPIDVARFQLSAVARIRPDVVAIMETELWFNFLWAAKAVEAKTLLINGRISDRSFKRSIKVRFFYSALLKFLDKALMQSQGDAERIQALGAKTTEVLGNCKFDEAIDGRDADVGWWRESLGIPEDLPSIVIGSSRGEEEETFILEALKLVKTDFALVWAPRHLERSDALSVSIRNQFGDVSRRSKAERGRFVLVDTYGELAKLYSIADVVVIGGGFANLGGQNLIQPLAHGKPVLHGPHMQNFRAAAEQAAQVGATRTCEQPSDLADAINDLLTHPEKAKQMGAAGAEFVARHEGAARRYAEAIVAEL